MSTSTPGSPHKRPPISETDSATFQAVSALPDETDPKFGMSSRDILQNSSPEILKEIFSDEAIDQNIRFKAFYCHQVYLRRSHQYSQHKENVDKYRATFQSHPMFKFMLAEFYGDTTADEASRELAIQYARQACRDLPGTPGVHHVLAEFLLESIELASSPLDPEARKAKLLEAEDHAGVAISLAQGTYPKFFATRARIQSLLGMDVTALESINRAIRDEDATNATGRARFIEYIAIRRQIANERLERSYRLEQQQAVQEFRSLRGELLSLLGLLAAVVAFISTTTSAALNLSAKDASSLILMCGAVIILIFSAFSTLFVKTPSRTSLLVTLISSLILMVGSFLVRNVFV